MSYYKRTIITEPVLAAHDRLLCPVRGKSSYVLVPVSDWESHAQNETSIDYSAVNYETHPWLRLVNYYPVIDVRPGDCLYVPNDW